MLVEQLQILPKVAALSLSNAVIESAARGKNSFRPRSPGADGVTMAVAFSRKAQRESSADPRDVDEILRLGCDAFLAGDYPTAREIFASLLPSLMAGAIDLEMAERPEDVLAADLDECVARFLASVYLTTSPDARVEEVSELVDGFYLRKDPIEEMRRAFEREPQDFESFVEAWNKRRRKAGNELLRVQWPNS